MENFQISHENLTKSKVTERKKPTKAISRLAEEQSPAKE
jgi:hypothetical protein